MAGEARQQSGAAVEPGVMTVGELARRSGMTRKTVRQLTDRGLIYSVGRSEAGYRLFDDSALWCTNVIRGLRSLGLTLAEIEQLAAIYLADPDQATGPELAARLDHAQARIEEHLRELHQIRRRIIDYRREHNDELTAQATPAIDDPRRRPKRP
jgi:DNA-binding transcriptional MerR regulator